MRWSSPSTRSMGLLFDDRCRSEAFCSNIKLKNASILAIRFVWSCRVLAKSAPHCKQLKELAELIAEEIRRSGPVTFARFMELALYCPVYGYYERHEDTIGRHGDFMTSVSAGGLFGEVLAFQFSEWLERIQPRSLRAELRFDETAAVGAGAGKEASERKLQLVEAGAHNGRLAGDILTWLRRHRAGVFQRLEYWILAPSPRRREIQRTSLSQFTPAVRWAAEFDELRRALHPLPASLQAPCVCGVIFSNA